MLMSATQPKDDSGPKQHALTVLLILCHKGALHCSGDASVLLPGVCRPQMTNRSCWGSDVCRPRFAVRVRSFWIYEDNFSLTSTKLCWAFSRQSGHEFSHKTLQNCSLGRMSRENPSLDVRCCSWISTKDSNHNKNTTTFPSPDRQTLLIQHHHSLPPRPGPFLDLTMKSSSATTTTSIDCVGSSRCMNSCEAYGRVCPLVGKWVETAVAQRLQELMKDKDLVSRRPDKKADAHQPHTGDGGDDDDDDDDDANGVDGNINAWSSVGIPTMEFDDLKLGRKIGEGGYCTIHEHGEDAVVKRLRLQIMANPDNFLDGALDLVAEAWTLAQVVGRHPNIIRLQAVAPCQSFASTTHDGKKTFFLVLERLDGETLQDRIDRWRREYYDSFFASTKSIDANPDDPKRTNNDDDSHNRPKTAQTSLLEYLGDTLSVSSVVSAFWSPTVINLQGLQERIDQVAIPVAKAIAFLHSQHIVLRDVKPENIGFDAVDGTIKLFDFGLARRVRVSHRDDRNDGNGTASATNHEHHDNQEQVQPQRAVVGSLRYMAPEAVLGVVSQSDSPSDETALQGLQNVLSVDVYAFGILLWQLCALQQPFQGYTPRQHRERVVDRNERPGLSHWWPAQFQDLLRRCWSPIPEDRPTMKETVSVLESTIKELQEQVDAMTSTKDNETITREGKGSIEQ